MHRHAIFALLCAAALSLMSAESAGRVAFSVGIAPPAPIVETVPPPPGAGYVWQPGYWSWNGVQWVWVPGTYVVAPYPGAVWVPGHWVSRPVGWVWVGGGWRR